MPPVRPNQSAPAAPPPDENLEELPPGEDEELQEKMRTIMPWVISFAIHAGLVIIAFAFFVTIKYVIEKKVPIPQSDKISDQTPGFDEEAGGYETASSNIPEDAAPAFSDAEFPTPSPMPSPTPTSVAVTAIGSTFKGGMPGSGVVGGKGTGPGMFGKGGGWGGGNGGGRGNKNGGYKLAYVIDASGSLVDTLPFVKENLMSVVQRSLLPNPSDPSKTGFNVIFFSGVDTNRDVGADRAPGLASVFNKLECPDDKIKNQAIQEINKAEAGGSGDPVKAIRKALDQGAYEIHILSDNITGKGIWEMRQDKFIKDVKDAIAATAAKRPEGRKTVRFVTYQFVYEDPLTQIGMAATLKKLVMETGGAEGDYAFVSARELGLR